MELKNKALFKESCFVGGKWVDSDSGEKIKVDNPANNEIIGEVPKCSTSETTKAIKEAQDAFPNWREKTAKELSLIHICRCRRRLRCRSRWSPYH